MDEPPEARFDVWLERCFLAWGQTELGDLIAEFEDGEAEYIADEAFAVFAQEFSTTDQQVRLSFLRQKIRTLLAQDPDHPHRAIRLPAGSKQQVASRQVVMKFEEQTDWHERLRALTWEQCVPTRPIPRLLRGGIPHFIVVHLFSGRRRDKDVHFWLASGPISGESASQCYRWTQLSPKSMGTSKLKQPPGRSSSGCMRMELSQLR